MIRDQRVDQFVQPLAFHDLRKFMQREIDAVVGNTRLRIIIGADLCRTVARTHHSFTSLRYVRLPFI